MSEKWVVIEMYDVQEFQQAINCYPHGKIVSFKHVVWFDDWEDNDGRHHVRNEQYTAIMEVL